MQMEISPKNLLLALLNEYKLFTDSFTSACNNFKGNTEYADVAAKMGFESNQEYNEIMFLREITHSVNAFNDIADIIRTYSKNPDMAAQRLIQSLIEVMYGFRIGIELTTGVMIQ